MTDRERAIAGCRFELKHDADGFALITIRLPLDRSHKGREQSFTGQEAITEAAAFSGAFAAAFAVGPESQEGGADGAGA